MTQVPAQRKEVLMCTLILLAATAYVVWRFRAQITALFVKDKAP